MRHARIGEPRPDGVSTGDGWSTRCTIRTHSVRNSFYPAAMAVSADDLDAVVTNVAVALRPATDRDWSAKAGSLDWDCWHTAEHVGDCLLSYAGQLAMQPQNRYVRFQAHADANATPAEVLEFAEAGGRMLVAAVRTAPTHIRAYHPTGQADPEGFAGMGCIEVLAHGYDIASGLGMVLDPPREVCIRVLARMFPQIAPDAAEDPWDLLLWATGRRDLSGRPAVGQWQWQGAPPGEAKP